ncbi:hypothetical protein IAI53_07075 [Thauera sp. CAU 1555]|uniref:Urate oxidase N-terminal domain-containing protein n=1 Tax=Thauera sedimentorum TaxID=2767595 RepID=A0ABR9B8G3_9RHOO|nr:hypothetical protein [Thauera sedimentorum]MBC9071725.1 hypothetical protein [Thauera sedimentorum]MBD8502644.1 hypothetical protein [Thauera sedimentorum]
MEGILLEVLARWLHFLGAIVWIGHNYATAVNRPRYEPLTAADLADPDSPRQQALLAREHGTFRYASLVTLGSGLVILWQRGWLGDALSLQGGLAPLGVGIWLGIAMVLNLWLVLWPNQKRVLGFVRAPLEDRLRASRMTFLSARVNTLLSIPVLFLMAAGAHGLALFS